jgi:diguanylate cyclase (GGDEF)-like protein
MFDYFGLIVAITVILLAIGIATPAVVAFMRSQERRRAEAQVRYLENYDTLTGLPNRRAFIERLTDAMVRMHRDKSSTAVVCLDIDKFKEINDASDHSGGDAVLREVGSRIQSTLRDGDIIARLGADEFAIALVDITNLGDVMAFMNRLVEALRRPLQIAGKEMICTTSVGVALAPADGENAAAILRHAAIALARAKSDGGQRMCFFEESMDKALQRRRMVEHELRLALSREEFDVVYQPQFNLAEETQCGAEALIRWNHPVHGRIAPGHFISVAEDTGLIVPLGEWVIDEACRQSKAWGAAGHLPVKIAVNVSALQFTQPNFAAIVSAALARHGIDPHLIELEITESLLMSNTLEAAAKLNQLREIGVGVALDDFGTGYSSLAYLQRLPIDLLKIDRSFVKDIDAPNGADNSLPVIRAIISLGHALNKQVLAEGVETQRQRDLLASLGCDGIQGYFLGKPMPANKVPDILPKSHAAIAA